MFVTLLKTPEGIFLYANPDGSIAASESEAAAVRVWENTYQPAHRVSHERSMSACFHMLMFQPSVIPVEGVEDICSFVENVDGSVQLVTLGTIAGSLQGVRCTESAESRWETGTQPRLI